jgi:hypothetical protein
MTVRYYQIIDPSSYEALKERALMAIKEVTNLEVDAVEVPENTSRALDMTTVSDEMIEHFLFRIHLIHANPMVIEVEDKATGKWSLIAPDGNLLTFNVVS